MIKTTIDLINLLNKSDNGAIDITSDIYFKRKRIKHLPNKKLYLCSKIVSLVKYSIDKYHISYLDLPMDYQGNDIALIYNNDYPWRYKTITLNELKMIDITNDINEFKVN